MRLTVAQRTRSAKICELAIAKTEQKVYPDTSEANGFSLVRKGQNEYLLLTDL